MLRTGLCIVPILTPRSKDVLVVFECEDETTPSTASAPGRQMSAVRSADRGRTWSAPELIWKPYVYGGPGPANGIVTSKGRIIIGYQVTTLLPHLWNSTNL